MIGKICPICGKTNSETAEFCSNCHASLKNILPLEISEEERHDDDGLTNLSGADDLPGLIQSLKQEEDLESIQGDQEQIELPGDSDLEDIFPDEEEPEEEEVQEVPEWLDRIRHRAKTEADSKGEITQKISAALDNISDDSAESRREDFKSWLERISKDSKDKDQQIKEPEVPEDAPQEEDEDWLTKIRKAEGKVTDNIQEDDDTAPDYEGDSLLQWLVDLEEGREEPSKLKDDLPDIVEAIDEDTHPTLVADELAFSQSTQKVVVEDADQVDEPRPVLEITREEQLQADQLTSTVVDERTARPSPSKTRKSSAWIAKLVISILLILSLVITLFFIKPIAVQNTVLKPQNEALFGWLEGLPDGCALLMVFDYQPGFASELTLSSQAILETIIEKNCDLVTISSSPSGYLLSRRLLTATGAIGQLEVKDLGYIPLGSVGGYQILGGNGAGEQLDYLPEPVYDLPTSELGGVLILSDRADGAKGWIEQSTALMLDVPINLILSAQAGPLALPYWESGQVNGMLAGITEAAGVESEISETPVTYSQWRAFQAGIVFLIIMILLGLIVWNKPISGQDTEEEIVE